MNKLKFIPALALVALLSACGSKASSIKAPKFQKEGQEIGQQECSENAGAKLTAMDLLGTKKIGSTTSSFNAKAEQKSTLNRNKKKFSEYSMMIDYNTKFEADAKSYVLHGEGKETMTYKSSDLHGSSTEVEGMKYNMYAQQITFGGSEFLGFVNPDSKTYRPYIEINENNLIADVFDEYAKDSIISEGGLLYLIQNVSTAFNVTGEQLERYKFYQNDNIFTVSYEYTPEIFENKNADDEVVSTVEEKTTSKTQFIFDGNNFKGVAYSERTITTKYIMDYTGNDDYFAGDVEEQKMVELLQCEIKTADLNIKPVDYSTYLFEDSVI